MTASIFRTAWWPLRLAIAWALTRDRAFVEDIPSRVGDSLLSIAIGLSMREADGTPIKRRFKCVDDAWSALREEMAAGRVRASGTPFRRVADAWGHAVETCEIAREIPAAEIASLELQDDGHEDVLVPEDWRVARGSNWHNLRGYRNVQVFRADVLRAFAVDGAATAAGETAAPQSHSKSRPALERARSAIKEVYPEGVPGQAAEPNAILCRRVGGRLKQAGLPGVSDDTILRAAGRRK